MDRDNNAPALTPEEHRAQMYSSARGVWSTCACGWKSDVHDRHWAQLAWVDHLTCVLLQAQRDSPEFRARYEKGGGAARSEVEPPTP